MPRKQKKYHYLYKTTNLINNKFYIGMHSTDNLSDDYIGSGKYLWNSIKKYGKENFKCEHIKFFDTRLLLKEAEINIVNEDLLQDTLCMNLMKGGEGGEGGFISVEQQKHRSECGGKAFTEKLKTDPEYAKIHSQIVSGNFKKAQEYLPAHVSVPSLYSQG